MSWSTSQQMCPIKVTNGNGFKNWAYSLCSLPFFFFHLRYIWIERPEKTITTLPHCFGDNGLPLMTDETTMLMNLRVVVIVVLVREPNRLMVRKMKFCPTAPHRQNKKMSQATSGFSWQNLTASKPLAYGQLLNSNGATNIITALYMVPQRFMPSIMSHGLVFGYLQLKENLSFRIRIKNQNGSILC